MDAAQRSGMAPSNEARAPTSFPSLPRRRHAVLRSSIEGADPDRIAQRNTKHRYWPVLRSHNVNCILGSDGTLPTTKTRARNANESTRAALERYRAIDLAWDEPPDRQKSPE